MGFKKTSENNANNNGNDKVDPKVWLNVGYESADPVTGEVTFVSLPLGIGLDTMKPRKVSGKNEDYRKLVESKNDLLQQLQDFVADFDFGQEEIIPDLMIQVRRIEEAAPVSDTETNPHLSTLSRLSFATKNRAA